MDNKEENSTIDFMKALDESIKTIHEGDIVKGIILSVGSDEVLVNIGYMADAVMAKKDLTTDDSLRPEDIVRVGDEIQVYIVKLNDGEGNVSVSKILADSIVAWDELKVSLNTGITIDIKISEIVKGGAIAYFKGIRTFIPASQLSYAYVENINDFLGKTLTVKVIELDKDKNRVVLSRKELEKEEVEAKKETLWNSLKKGEKRSGVVSRLAKFGAFVDLGGVDGLIHLNDLSWKRVLNPSEVVSVGDKVEVFVIDFDKAKNRISLGLKDVSEDPWNSVAQKYKAGAVVEGTIRKFLEFGAFVELEPGVEGLVHISEISEERILKPSDVLKIGDKVQVKILDIDKDKQRISLSIKDVSNKPSEDFSQFTDSDSSVTLGDLFKDKLKDFKFD